VAKNKFTRSEEPPLRTVFAVSFTGRRTQNHLPEQKMLYRE